jgi:DNA-directed RNA polymerase subunit L/DNA-directed RNA polymerase alpha subunit
MSANIFNDLEQVDPHTIKFCLRPVIVSYANALRRAIQTEVSVLGFRADMTEDGSTSDVKIFKNSTPMSNEMLADRVGLLPIVMTSDSWVKESVLFRLKVVNTTDEVRMVTASDFECLEKRDDAEERVRIPNTQFFHPNPVTGETCLIAVLKPMVDGQEPEEIHLEAYASLGKGREHARFNPTSQCSYAYTRDTDPVKIKALFNTWVKEQKKVDPVDLDKDADRKAVLEREFRSLEIYRCYLQDPDGEPYSFDFTVETIGTLPIQKIVYEALVSLATLVEKYSNIDSGDLPENIEIRPADARLKGYDFWIGGEDHTLGNILQTWLDENEVGSEISFAGYKIPHPLRDEMVLRIGVDDGQQDTARGAIARACRSCADMFRSWAVQWNGVGGSSKIRNPWEAHADTKGRPKNR